jgi:dihydropteroate synthase
MGVVNVTPDSFSDGGRAGTPDDAVAHALRLAAEGADILDIGGESSRPGAEPVPLEEELRRVIPVIEALSPRVEVPISVDTTKAEVARRALAAGAAIVNDIRGLSGDLDLPRIVAQSGAGVVLMHMAGTPRTMQDNPHYDDVVGEVRDYLARRVDAVERAGVPRARIAIDPGIGFGKTLAHNLALLRNLERFATLGCAVVIGTSRKGFLGTLTGRPVGQRATASVVSALAAILGGADVVRVHDVAPMVDAITVWAAQRGWDATSRLADGSHRTSGPCELVVTTSEARSPMSAPSDLCDEQGPIPEFPPAVIDPETGRARISDEEWEARRQASLRMLKVLDQITDETDQDEELWKEAMRDFDSFRPHRKQFEGMY